MPMFLSSILDRIKSRCIDPSLKLLELQLAIYYVEGIKKAHRLLMLVCMLVCVITVFGAGLVLVPVALLFYAPWEPATKAIVGISIGALYVIVPAIALSILLSEKRWMRLTGASALLRKLVD